MTPQDVTNRPRDLRQRISHRVSQRKYQLARPWRELLIGLFVGILFYGVALSCQGNDKRDPYVSMGNYDGVAR